MIPAGVIDILLVEDNPNDLELALRALRKGELAERVVVARDGVEALDYVFGEGTHSGRRVDDAPRMVLLDLKLPKVDGMEVLRRIKSDARTRSIPVVMLTSSREQRDVVESYQCGVNSYVVKPVNFEQFTEAVKEIGRYWLARNQPPRMEE